MRNSTLSQSIALGVLASIVTMTGCASGEEPPSEKSPARQTEQAVDVLTSTEAARESPSFQKYWYRGQAELNRYELRQFRYGESRDGEAIFIFVTEPFLEDEQVKLERGDRSSEDAVSVLKLNAHRRFYTGIYPYNILTSTFTPVEGGSTLKVQSSTMEWCGQTYAQLNFRDGRYKGVAHSYFQGEADQDFDLEGVLLEDELYSQIRRSPSKLPVGDVKLIPSAHYLRLMHKPFVVQKAKASLAAGDGSEFNDVATRLYTVDYGDLDRKLEIEFEEKFPHRIVEWRETYPGFDGEQQTTSARLKRSIMLDYWNKNGREDAVYRKALGLEF